MSFAEGRGCLCKLLKRKGEFSDYVRFRSKMSSTASRLTYKQNFGPEVKEKASIYVPAIGKVTIVVLLRNLLRIVQNRRAGESRPAEPVEKAGTVEAAKPLDVS